MKKLYALAALTLVGTPAIAAESQGFYASVGGGVYRIDSNGFDDRAPSAMLTAGYDINQYFGVESTWSRLFNASDRVSGTKVTIDGNVWDLTTRLSYPVNDRVDPYLRMGWSYSDLAAKTTTIEGEPLRLNDYDDGFSWAAGAGFSLTPRLDLKVEYARMLVTNDDLDRVSASVTYRFGAR
ncbi:MAG: porin family protein [Gammaproteobacteria bacterium]|nr:porin family protein [Gammaproteobacteria bacterium]